MSEPDRIREEYRSRAETIPPDRYAWHREEIQYWQASTARVCARLLQQSGAFPLTDARIADIGCGDGNWLLEFLQWGARAGNLHGIDLIEDRVASARERLPGADIRCGDAAHLPWPGRSFDLVTQFAVFSSILDSKMREGIAHEMQRILRPGGRILWYDLRYSNPKRSAVRGLTRHDIHELFPGWRVRFANTTLAPPLSRAVARYSWFAAGVIESLGITCTHIAAVITAP